MATKLIKLDDDTLVEVEVPHDQAQPIAGGAAERINETFDKIRPILVKTCRPIAAAWTEISQDAQIEQAEVEIGLSFEAEGNLYVTKSKGAANLVVKLILKPRASSQ